MQLDLLAHYENTRKRILPCGPKIVCGFEYFHNVKWNIFVETIVIRHLHILKTDGNVQTRTSCRAGVKKTYIH